MITDDRINYNVRSPTKQKAERLARWDTVRRATVPLGSRRISPVLLGHHDLI